MQSIDVQPARVAAGDTATVTVRVRDEPCYSDERSPHGVSLFASRGSDGARALVARGTTDAGGFFVFAERVTESTTYDFSGAGQGRLGGTTTRLTVDRVSGSCTGPLTLSAPATVDTGQTVTVTGTSSDTATVSISFRRRGQTAFSARRAGLQPTGLQGSFGTTFRADDDYRLFASNERCDSDVVLTQAAPVLLGGPARVRKGSVVPLTVRATQGTALSVAFRRSGQTAFTVRRNGTADSRGVYTTTYLADADYEYVAAERAGQRSAPRTTQAR